MKTWKFLDIRVVRYFQSTMRFLKTIKSDISSFAGKAAVHAAGAMLVQPARLALFSLHLALVQRMQLLADRCTDGLSANRVSHWPGSDASNR